MNKLEEKLNELGYNDALFIDIDVYYKWINSIWRVDFEIEDGIIKDAALGIGTDNLHNEEFYKDVDLMQEALNEMRKDLAILKKLEVVKQCQA